jgi:hypothetical protein
MPEIPAVFDHGRGDGDVRVHLDRRSGYFSIALRIMEVTDRQATTVDEAWKVDGNPLPQVSNVHVAAEFPRGNRAQALSGMRAFDPAQ